MKAEVKQHNGTATLFLNGQAAFAGYLWASPPSSTEYAVADVARAYADAGIHAYAVDVGVVNNEPEWCGPGPGRDGDFDFSTVEARYGRILDADADARFHLRLHLEMGRDPGAWWRRRYPEECELDSAGTRTTQSFASEMWREQTNTFLRAYAAHLKTTGLSDRVFAYQVGAGHTGEWVKGRTSMWDICGDYSTPMRILFQEWLRRSYDNDVSALRAAWADKDIAFDTAQVPSADAQLTTTHMSFRDPRHEQPVIDYYRCLAERCADLIIDFCRTVKDAAGRQTLAGAFFGYIMELAWNAGFFGENIDSPYGTTQRSGHLGLAKVLRAPEVDFLVSPYSYGFRGIGGLGCAMPPSESMRIHNKLFLFEDDTRTYLAPPDAGFGRAVNLEDSIAVLKRNMAEIVTRGMGVWWQGNSMHVDPLREPAFQTLLSQFQEIGTFALSLDRSPGADIAVIIDDESFYYESVRNDLDLPLIFQQRLWGLARLGAPNDTYLLQDLLEDRLPAYKLYIFLNAFRLNTDRRAALDKALKRDGRTALWLYAPGYIKEAPALDNMTELTGFQFGMGERPWNARMHITNFDHPVTRNLPPDTSWGIGGQIGPLFHLEDEEAAVLGETVYSLGRCKPGFGVKTFPDWTSIYSAVPDIPAPVLRAVARFAGVHLYSEAGDVLFAGPQLFAVHTVAGGERSFTLPCAVEVVHDLFAHNTVAHNTDSFTVTLPARSTTLYFTGPAGLVPAGFNKPL